jgi:hypothetical protein
VKKIVGLLLLVAAFGMFAYARMRSAAVDKDVRFYIRMAADARERETEISSLNNKITMNSVAIGDAIVKHLDETSLQTGMLADRARLMELERAETALGSAAVNEEAANSAEHRRWVVMVMYVGSVLAGLIGIGYLVK